ncbi:unnamed protein product, partial [Rotaria socialis]
SAKLFENVKKRPRKYCIHK